MKKKFCGEIVLSITLTMNLMCFCLSFTREGWGAETISDLDRQIAAEEKAGEELNKKIQQYKETAQKKAQQERSLLGRITDLQQNSKMAQQQITLLELEERRLQKSITALNLEMTETSRSVNALLSKLRTRVLNMYKYGSREELNLLLSAENTHEAVVSAYLLDRLARHDQILIEELLSKMTELEKAKRDLAQHSSQLATKADTLYSQRKKYTSSVNETHEILSSVQRERRSAEVAAKEIEQAQQEIGNTIRTLMQKKRERALNEETPKIEKAPSTENKAKNANASSDTKKKPSQTYPALGRGSLLEWPLKGKIVLPYGSRVHPTFKTKTFNSGIDIGASSGATVKSAGSGEVLFEGWLRGFGQVVIIDHGGNISTVYAHLASTRVKERDTVNAGTVIGTVGNTGTMEGYNLHFEVRLGESAKNPLDYLKKA